MESMFEVASRMKVRFSYKGLLAVEDLWDLSLESLDTIFKTLNRQVKDATEDSLLTERSKEDKLLLLKVDIIKYIVLVKMQEAAAAKDAAAKRAKKQRVLSILADKQDEALKNMSEADLEKMLNEL